MIKKIFLVLAILILAFLGYVATRSGKFSYSRSGVINASADKIFPYISNFKLGSEWSPFEKKDPNMKKTYGGVDGQVGSTLEFEGNREVGSGKLEILKIVPFESVDIKLNMIKPFKGENFIQYKLTPEGSATRFTWTMSGDGGFPAKLMSVLIDCEKMIGKEFEAGIANLKSVVESSGGTK